MLQLPRNQETKSKMVTSPQPFANIRDICAQYNSRREGALKSPYGVFKELAPRMVVDNFIKDEKSFDEFLRQSLRVLAVESPALPALYIAYNRELPMVQDLSHPGEYRMGRFNAENVSHVVVLRMINELVASGMKFEDGQLRGKGTISLAAETADGKPQKDLQVPLDFSAAGQSLGKGIRVAKTANEDVRMEGSDLKSFLDLYLKPGPDGQPLFVWNEKQGRFIANKKATIGVKGNNIFLNSFQVEAVMNSGPNPMPISENGTFTGLMRTIFHETFHGFREANPKVRKYIDRQISSLNPEQRESALIYLSGYTTLYDPDKRAEARQLLATELTAYWMAGSYEPRDMEQKNLSRMAKFFCDSFKINADLTKFKGQRVTTLEEIFSILGIKEEHRSVIKADFGAKHKENPQLNEEKYLKENGQFVLGHSSKFGPLRQIIMEQFPLVYEKVKTTASNLF